MSGTRIRIIFGLNIRIPHQSKKPEALTGTMQPWWLTDNGIVQAHFWSREERIAYRLVWKIWINWMRIRIRVKEKPEPDMEFWDSVQSDADPQHRLL